MAIVETTATVTLLGGGELAREDVDDALRHAPFLVAADGAAATALAFGHLPEAVIGDLDSIDAATVARIPPARLHRIREQDSTDFEKCLRSIRAPLILGAGFTGGRLDHGLAACNALVRHRAGGCILLGALDICFHAPAQLRLDLAPGTRVSLFPMAPVRVRSTGLRWPTDSLDFAPDGRIGTSNEATGPAELRAGGPGMLVILPRGALDVAMAALTAA